ncbi:MAG: hypothetical protein MJZ12_00055 [Prevotella sp.]|nr:hypothetical protein [Prevotella sp.]
MDYIPYKIETQFVDCRTVEPKAIEKEVKEVKKEQGHLLEYYIGDRVILYRDNDELLTLAGRLYKTGNISMRDYLAVMDTTQTR